MSTLITIHDSIHDNTENARIMEGTTAYSYVESDPTVNLAKVDVFVNGELVDAEYVLEQGDTITIATRKMSSGAYRARRRMARFFKRMLARRIA